MSEAVRKPPPGLTESAERSLRRVAVIAVFVIAAAAAVLSFNGLRNLALSADIPYQLAWIFPIVVDGLTLVGSLGVVHAVLSGLRSWYPWMLTIIGVALSVWGNVASSPPEITAQIVHAIPPIVLALSLEALLKVYRYRAVAGYLDQQATTPEEHEAVSQLLAHAPVPGEAPTWKAPEEDLHVPEGPFVSPQGPLSFTPDVVFPPEVVEVSEIPSPPVEPKPKPRKPAGSKKPTIREMLSELLEEDPDISASEAARILGKDRSNVGKILRELRADD